MRAAALTGPGGGLELVDVADPTPGPDEVVLGVDAAGICGSDLHAIRSFAPGGTIMGHEFAGEIVALGTDVDDPRWTVGRHVTARPMRGCARCDACESGRPERCGSFGLIGMERPGGWASFVAVPARELFAAPASLSPQDAAVVEPLAVASRALHRAGSVEGEHILVLGGGPVGLAVTAWARARRAETVVVSEPDPLRRDLAEGLGAHPVDPAAGNLAGAFLELAGCPPGVVIECVGRPGLIAEAMDMAGFDGRVVVVGVCMAHDQVFPWSGLSKELDIRFALYYEAGDFTATIEALDDGSLEIAGFVTDRIPLAELPGRFDAMVTTPSGGKVLVLPGA